jgi:enoyl-CoA hydratase
VSYSSDPSPDVIIEQDNLLGTITLNRPKALNSLTLDMVLAIDRALSDMAESDVTTILIRGAGGRALCAGGDIRAIYDAMLVGDSSPRDFWTREYRLNARLASYPKPIVAIMDGIVMGGGVGLASHATIRIVTERSMVAMPEVGIGFCPDVGSTWLLSRSPDHLGTHVALSTARLNAADAILSGLADYFVPSESLPALIQLMKKDDAREVLVAAAQRTPESDLTSAASPWIEECYAGETVEEILERLDCNESEDARNCAAAIRTKSPTALKVAVRALQTARSLPSLESCLAMEYRISLAFLQTPDFREGIRAAVVDKDQQPQWNPNRLDQVTKLMVDRFFVQGDPNWSIADQEVDP